MSSQRLKKLPAVQKQRLLIEFSCLKSICPYGIFLTLTPGDFTRWSGVMFVRRGGPYSSAILRFHISFPALYPTLPPIVTFTTDIFHPLIKPLSAYVHPADNQLQAHVSTTNDDRLPPGGFSLQHGFPSWFSNGQKGNFNGDLKKIISMNEETSRDMSETSNLHLSLEEDSSKEEATQEPNIYELLRYIRSTFDSEEILDEVPLKAAGNPGAWHAWWTYRAKQGKFPGRYMSGDVVTVPKDIDGFGAEKTTLETRSAQITATQTESQKLPPLMTSKMPEEWNWDGVWEVRVKKGIEASISESVLFKKDSGDDLIRFLHMDCSQIEAVKEDIKRSVEAAGPQV
ncbi:ubiquitin-conjugating enzyme [Blumeria hordei DH14]|uniref:Ubiquitin-conjugating enzyme n=1 Tax=Blumeria graminis f. sp. hordei (strain DH14) TaxID=546991 RepID=N1JFQ2_BLUG1|nr:ubiquitin-conjugating enzyme [Blumeria hordei DH14]